MSYCLFVFHVSSPRTRDQLLAQAQSHYEPIGESGEDVAAEREPVVEPSPRIEAFLQDLNGRYPSAEAALSFPAEDRWKSPWAGSMAVAARTVEIPMGGAAPEDAHGIVVALAKRYELICVGPMENGLVYAPPALGPPSGLGFLPDRRQAVARSSIRRRLRNVWAGRSKK